MKKLILITGVVASLAGGSALAEAGQGKGRPDGGDQARSEAREGKAKGKSKKCAKPRRVGFVVKGTFVSGDATSVTLTVTKANSHAKKSGLVTVGESYTATPTKASRIRYVNRSGPGDAQQTDKVRVVGKVTKLKRGCDSEGFTPEATVRKVTVIGPDTSVTPPSEGSSSED